MKGVFTGKLKISKDGKICYGNLAAARETGKLSLLPSPALFYFILELSGVDSPNYERKHEKFLHSLARVMQHLPGNEPHEPPKFGGDPGEPVPTVDPEDLKTVWKIQKELSQQSAATGAGIFQQACRPGADIQAVVYRSWLLWFMTRIAPEHLERFSQPDEAVFRAAAKVPAEWMGVGIVRNGLPFDVNEFLKLCEERV